MAEFEIAVGLTLKHEGGYTPGLDGDPGGATNYGISQRAYPTKDIQHLSKAEARDIYRHDYWLSLYDQIGDQKIANALFDFGVNAGISRAVKTIQRAVGDILAGPFIADGVFGPDTLAAVNSCEPAHLLMRFTARRIDYYQSLNKPQFIKGWTARALDT